MRERTDRLAAAHESVLAAVRRQTGQQSAIGPRAAKTRQRLIDAARDLIREAGYDGASPSQIAARCEVSVATFYQYFPDLAGVVAAIAGERVVEMLALRGDRWDPLTGRLGLRRMISVFVQIYFSDLEFYEVWDRATAADPRLASLRRNFWAAYKERVEEDLRQAVELGAIRSDLDPGEMARALTLMTERYCYDIAIFDPPEQRPTSEHVTDTLAALWADALVLTEARELRKNSGA